MPVFCVKLDRVPGLLPEHKASVRRWLRLNKNKGEHNLPRRFNDGKNVKCTVVSEEAFSGNVLAALISGLFLHYRIILQYYSNFYSMQLLMVNKMM